MSKTVDIADALANGSDLDALLSSATSVVPLAERKAKEIAIGRKVLSDAVLLLGSGSVIKEERSKAEKAIVKEAVAVAWFLAIEPAECERLLCALASSGSFAESVRRIRKAVATESSASVSKEVLAEQQQQQGKKEAALAKFTDVDAASSVRSLPGSSIPSGLTIPLGYHVSPKGIFTVSFTEGGEEKVKQICQRPVFITGRLVDVDGALPELVVLRWYNGRSWSGRVVPRAQVCQARELAGLSGYGIPTGSSSSSAMSEWLESFLVHNEPKLPCARAVPSMGWRDLESGLPSFIIGPEVWRAGKPSPSILDNSDPTEWPTTAFHLRADDPVACRAWRTNGTWEEWLEVVELCRPFAAFGLALRAALAPIILRLVGGSNFVIDIAGLTSQGKSTSVYFAASALGYPNEKDNGIVRQWNATRVSIERNSAFCADLPLFMDDTKQLSKKQVEDVSSIIYMVVGGQAKGRGNISGGNAPTSTWHTVMVATGETPITELAQAGGAAARTISLFGSPLGDTKQADLAVAIREGSFSHYGHCARRMIAWLQSDGNIGRIKVWYEQEMRALKVAAEGEPAEHRAVLARASDYVATLAVVGRILEAIGVPAWKADPQALAISALAGTVAKADRPTEALASVYAWCCERPESFWGRQRTGRDGDGSPMGNKWSGSWSEKIGWEWIGINDALLRDILRQRGFDVEATLQTWHSRNWTMRQEEKRAGNVVTHKTIVTKVNGVATRCVAIRRDALTASGVLATGEVSDGE